MKSNVHYLPGANIPPRQVLEGAVEHGLDTVLVIGKQQDGRLYMAGSTDDMGEVSLLLTRAQAFMVRMIVDEYGDER